MSQEKVREILSHVDMTKIDLSSFRLSEKKFNEVATLYRNRLLLSCVAVVATKEQHTPKQVDAAFDLLNKIAENPDLYSYDYVYHHESIVVDDAINEVVSYRNRMINGVKIKGIENRMKATYKEMRKSIEMVLENGGTFDDELNEETVNRCLSIAQEGIRRGREKAQEEHEMKAAEQESAQDTITVEEPQTPVDEAAEPAEMCQKTEKPEKVPFWKKLFSRA